MVFNRHLKALNLCNHSDTIACVLYELLVNLELIIVGFQTHVQGSTSFSFVQFSRSCWAVACFVTACILYLIKVLLSRTFMRYFFEALRLQNRYTGCRYRLQRLCSLRDSLIIIARSTTFVKNFFRIFLQSFGGVFRQGVYSGCVV